MSLAESCLPEGSLGGLSQGGSPRVRCSRLQAPGLHPSPRAPEQVACDHPPTPGLRAERCEDVMQGRLRCPPPTDAVSPSPPLCGWKLHRLAWPLGPRPTSRAESDVQ